MFKQGKTRPHNTWSEYQPDQARISHWLVCSCNLDAKKVEDCWVNGSLLRGTKHNVFKMDHAGKMKKKKTKKSKRENETAKIFETWSLRWKAFGWLIPESCRNDEFDHWTHKGDDTNSTKLVWWQTCKIIMNTNIHGII